MMSNMQAGGGAAGAGGAPPMPIAGMQNTNVSTAGPMPDIATLKTKYAEQLTKIKEMGFYDEEQILKILHETSGNVDYAIERLL